MNISNKRYIDLVEKRQKKPKVLSDCIKAFVVGGAICTLGEALKELYMSFGASKESAGTIVSITLILIAEFLTALGVFYYIAKFAGAGTLVPITGFANAVASQAVDSNSEGFITGVGANIFAIAGPVILYGTTASVIYGIIYWIIGLF